MGYIEKNLMDGEQIIYKAKNHWWVYMQPILLFLFGSILTSFGEPMSWAGYFIMAYSAYTFLRVLILVLTSQYVLTNKRIVLKYGFISRTSRELFLNKMESMDVKQSVTGRILGFGSVAPTTGEKSVWFDYIKKPMKFKNAVNEQIAKQD